MYAGILDTRFEATALIFTTPSGSNKPGTDIKQSHWPPVLLSAIALQHGTPLYAMTTVTFVPAVITHPIEKL